MSYIQVGPLLLDDETGALTAAIESECQKNAVNINTKIFMNWLQGKGKLPVTWETLVDVLKQVRLCELAGTIEKALR